MKVVLHYWMENSGRQRFFHCNTCLCLVELISHTKVTSAKHMPYVIGSRIIFVAATKTTYLCIAVARREGNYQYHLQNVKVNIMLK